MAEFCLDCYNRVSGKTLTEKEIKLSRGRTLCEGCGKWRQVIVKIKNSIKNGTHFP